MMQQLLCFSNENKQTKNLARKLAPANKIQHLWKCRLLHEFLLKSVFINLEITATFCLFLKMVISFAIAVNTSSILFDFWPDVWTKIECCSGIDYGGRIFTISTTCLSHYLVSIFHEFKFENKNAFSAYLLYNLRWLPSFPEQHQFRIAENSKGWDGRYKIFDCFSA